MTNLGMKIVGDELEVGFTVSSREEFDAAIARLQTVAATIWPASAAAQRGIDEEEKYRLAEDAGFLNAIPRPGEYVQERRTAVASWREDQGLR